jgi:hypothetical protein
VLQQERSGDERTWSLFPNLRWRPNFAWGAVMAGAFLLCVIYAEGGTTFLYFQF